MNTPDLAVRYNVLVFLKILPVQNSAGCVNVMFSAGVEKSVSTWQFASQPLCLTL